MEGCEITDESLYDLADWSHTGVLLFDLSKNKFSSQAICDLLQSDIVSSVEYLILNETKGDALTVRAMLNSPYLQNLDRVDFDDCPIGPEGIAHLARIRHPSLTKLSLRGTKFGDEAAMMLANSPLADKLEILCFRQSDVGPAGMQILQSRFDEDVLGIS